MKRVDSELERYMEGLGFRLRHSGKVRDTFVSQGYPDKLLTVASDRISIFDFVLPATIPGKGEVLTALTHFWLNGPLSHVANHLGFPRQPLTSQLREDFPAERALMVDELDMVPFEYIYRAHLGGSVWKPYLETAMVAGQPLPAGLQKWHKFDYPLFTPSTKEEQGHDRNITVQEYDSRRPRSQSWVQDWLREAYVTAYEFARNRGIVILDTKFEIGTRVGSVEVVLGDEVLTPDSSRFAMVDDYENALSEERDPAFLDKQIVREWGAKVETPKGLGLSSLDPTNPDDLAFVAGLTVPQAVIKETQDRYGLLFYLLTRQSLEEYQRSEMGIFRTAAA